MSCKCLTDFGVGAVAGEPDAILDSDDRRFCGDDRPSNVLDSVGPIVCCPLIKKEVEGSSPDGCGWGIRWRLRVWKGCGGGRRTES